MVAGNVARATLFTWSTAAPSDTPCARLNDSVTDAICPECGMELGPVVHTNDRRGIEQVRVDAREHRFLLQARHELERFGVQQLDVTPAQRELIRRASTSAANLN